MHESLADAMNFCVSGIMAGAMQGKQRKHAAVPVAHAASRISMIFVLNIKAPAGRAHIGASTAVDARKCDLLPKGCLVQFVGIDIS